MTSTTELFGRLAGDAAALTVVTPNRRLAHALLAQYDAWQLARGREIWDAADIVPYAAFLQRNWEDAFYSDAGTTLPQLLAPAQEEQLWRQVVAGSGLIAVDETAARCREAWGLMHEWRIRPGNVNEDAAAFASWAEAYARKADLDAARLPDFLLGMAKDLALPATLVPFAFDILPPQTREFFEGLAAHGVEVLPVQPQAQRAQVSRSAFPSAKAELEHAAQWARARLEGGAQCIGVVVPDLQLRRREVARVFGRIVAPAFNISLGVPLADYPLVDAALALLELSQGDVRWEAASRLLRSPFLGGAEREAAARARLEVRLRRKLAQRVSLAKLIAHAERTPGLRALLEKLYGFRDQGLFSAKTPGEWARHFSATLAAAGFPGERGLDSAEFQTQAKWHEALGEFARLDRVCRELPFGSGVGILRKLCADTLFQPEGGDAPVQVLGVLESAGAQFDCLWLSGLTDEAWPLKPRPNPFLPVAPQIRAGVPEASAESSLALDRRITEGWQRAAAEVVFSWPARQDDRELAPSPLIRGIAERAPEVPQVDRLRDLIFAAAKTEILEDRAAPPVRAPQVDGGTRVLSDQAACPFRAYARWRLRADGLEEPAEGLDASQRGALLHELMKHLWTALKDSTALERDVEPCIEQAADAAVRELELEGRFADLERKRLAQLARDWLALEKTRPAFEVIGIEQKTSLGFAGLEFSARIDRMDRLSTGGHALIDYKTSRNPSPRHWEPPRPDDPQLALYAVSAKEEVTAVAFAKVRPGEMRFMGFSRDEHALPRVQKAKAWQPLLRAWKDEAESLGRSFAGGEAGVDPKKDLLTCRYCGLETLCRVYEKVNVLAEAEEEE
ncbi:MAG: PD-(D/E)XK nuclease family protein [Betaproteobacteria bacterium]